MSLAVKCDREGIYSWLSVFSHSWIHSRQSLQWQRRQQMKRNYFEFEFWRYFWLYAIAKDTMTSMATVAPAICIQKIAKNQATRTLFDKAKETVHRLKVNDRPLHCNAGWIMVINKINKRTEVHAINYRFNGLLLIAKAIGLADDGLHSISNQKRFLFLFETNLQFKR